MIWLRTVLRMPSITIAVSVMICITVTIVPCLRRRVNRLGLLNNTAHFRHKRPLLLS